MPVKRSRIGRSSSFGETDLFNRLTSFTDPLPLPNRRIGVFGTGAAAYPSSVVVGSPAKVMKSEPVKRVLTLSSPERECVVDKRDQKQIQGFLDKCYFCRKKIPQNSEIYMYSYLRAFCTAECRQIQIQMDKQMEKQRSEKMDGVQHG